jgi:pyrroline-5-carboxylate reductase
VAGFKVAIVGAAGMGALLAMRIPGPHRKVIIGSDRAEAAALADEVGGVASDQASAVRGCQVVFLAVPGTDAMRTVLEASPHLAEGAMVVNMAADVATADLAAEFPAVRFAAAKVLGHVREMSLGSPGVVVLDHVPEAEDEERLRSLLEGMGPIVSGREGMVPQANAAVAAAMARVREALHADLTALGLDRQLARMVIAATAPGVLRDSVANGDTAAAPPAKLNHPETGAVTGPRTSH